MARKVPCWYPVTAVPVEHTVEFAGTAVADPVNRSIDRPVHFPSPVAMIEMSSNEQPENWPDRRSVKQGRNDDHGQRPLGPPFASVNEPHRQPDAESCKRHD